MQNPYGVVRPQREKKKQPKMNQCLRGEDHQI